jgi:hypothetical protein
MGGTRSSWFYSLKWFPRVRHWRRVFEFPWQKIELRALSALGVGREDGPGERERRSEREREREAARDGVWLVTCCETSDTIVVVAIGVVSRGPNEY